MDYVQIITIAAKKVGVSASVLIAICSHESGEFKYNHNENDNGSPSFGICQVKMGTAFELGFKGNRAALQKPETNAYYAALYLNKQLDRYKGNLLKSVAAYNSGTYYEVKKHPGCPGNMEYVKKVQSYLEDEELSSELECERVIGKGL